MSRAGAAMVVAVAAAAESVAIAYLVTRLASFQIGDVGGYVYCLLATPAVAAIAGAVVFLALPGSAGTGRRIGIALAALAVGSAVFHAWALDRRMIGGWWVLPAGFDATRLSSAQLAERARSRNQEVSGAALSELARRGPEGAAALLDVIAAVERDAGAAFVNVPVTVRAAEELARQHDRRVLPVLEQMLGSERGVVETVVDANGTAHRTLEFPIRMTAAKLMAEGFDLHPQVETRRALP